MDTSLDVVEDSSTANVVAPNNRLEIDHLLEQGFRSGDWTTMRASLSALTESRDSYEGYHLGLATASFYADDDLESANKAIEAALSAPSSRWRPDSFRLEALILQRQGLTDDAREAVEAGLQAVDQLELDENTTESYRTWVGQALSDDAEHPNEPVKVDRSELIDGWLDEAYATGDWALCRKRLESEFQAESDSEGVCLGHAEACFHLDHNRGDAEDWLRVALGRSESRWRPDVYRLLGDILQARSDLNAAETALDAALDAVPRLNCSDEEKARYVDWIEVVLQPVRSRLLVKNRGGIKSVLRNGILTGERSDKRECREALIALKEIERSWAPDFVSVVFFVPIWRVFFIPILRRTITFVRVVFQRGVRYIRVAVRLWPRVGKATFVVVILGVIAYGVLKSTADMCLGSSGSSCSSVATPAIGVYLGACEQIAAIIWSLFTGLVAIVTVDNLAKLPQEAANAAIVLLALAFLIPPATYLIAAFIVQKTTRYTLLDGRLTIEAGIIKRQRSNFEILHASHFTIQQGLLSRSVRRASFVFYTVSIGGHQSEPVVVYGRRKTILTLETQIRGLVRMLRTVARLKGIVAVD